MRWESGVQEVTHSRQQQVDLDAALTRIASLLEEKTTLQAASGVDVCMRMRMDICSCACIFARVCSLGTGDKMCGI